MNYNRLMIHTAVVNRHSGTVNAAGDIPYDDGKYSINGTIDCRRLTTSSTSNSTGGQQVAERDGKIRNWSFLVYALPSADVLFGDRLTNITTKKTGGDGWGQAATVLEAGPLEVTAVTDVIERGLNIKVLEVERVT